VLRCVRRRLLLLPLVLVLRRLDAVVRVFLITSQAAQRHVPRKSQADTICRNLRSGT
jgi:hypothetical protein